MIIHTVLLNNYTLMLHIFFFRKGGRPRPLHLDDACSHFINYSRRTLQSHTAVRLKPPSRQHLCYSYPVDERMLIVWALDQTDLAANPNI